MKLNQFEWQCEPNIPLSLLITQVSPGCFFLKEGSIDEIGIATSYERLRCSGKILSKHSLPFRLGNWLDLMLGSVSSS